PVGDGNARGLKRGDLALRGPGVPGNDRAGMPEPFSGRSRTAADERDRGLVGEMLFDERGSVFFVGAADLAADDERVCLRIVGELPQAVDESRPDDGIAADADARRLAQTRFGQVVDDLVR